MTIYLSGFKVKILLYLTCHMSLILIHLVGGALLLHHQRLDIAKRGNF